MDYLSSMYIDNEMALDEKKQFVEKVRSDRAFYQQTLDLLAMEQLLAENSVLPEPAIETRGRTSVWSGLANFFKPLGFATVGFSAAVLMFVVVFQPQGSPLCTNRFVLFQPSVDRVELVGSFTGWQRMAMKQIGTSGYWELNLPVVSGEHRFAYILDGDSRIADPTMPARETDDFGGENSILSVAIL